MNERVKLLPAVRLAVLASGPCAYCASPSETVDHIIPVVHGGTNDRSNLAPACYICNYEKGNLSADEYYAYRISEAIALRGLLAEYETHLKGQETPEMEVYLTIAVQNISRHIARLESLPSSVEEGGNDG